MISKTYHKYIWLLNTLLTSSPLTFDEVNMLWEDSPANDGPIPLRTFHDYMSNEAWKKYLETMAEEHRKQYKDGNGGELKEKKGRWGIVPPKHGLKWRMPK